MIDMNEGARLASISVAVANGVPAHQRRVRQVNDLGNTDAARLALLMEAVGEVSRVFCWGGRALEDAVIDVETAAHEWARALLREAAR